MLEAGNGKRMLKYFDDPSRVYLLAQKGAGGFVVD